jgi:hypothetical protein
MMMSKFHLTVKTKTAVAVGSSAVLGACLVSRRLGASTENISNSTHDAPADGQTKTNAQKSNHCCNAP